MKDFAIKSDLWLTTSMRIVLWDANELKRYREMGLADYLRAQEMLLHGSTISGADTDRLTSAISGGEVLRAYADVLLSFRLCGVPFSLAEDEDLSGIGAERRLIKLSVRPWRRTLVS